MASPRGPWYEFAMVRFPVTACWLLACAAACSLNTAGEWPVDGGAESGEADGAGPDVAVDGPEVGDDGEAADEADGSSPSHRKPYAAPEGIPGECMNLPLGLDEVPPACRALFGQ